MRVTVTFSFEDSGVVGFAVRNTTGRHSVTVGAETSVHTEEINVAAATHNHCPQRQVPWKVLRIVDKEIDKFTFRSHVQHEWIMEGECGPAWTSFRYIKHAIPGNENMCQQIGLIVWSGAFRSWTPVGFDTNKDWWDLRHDSKVIDCRQIRARKYVQMSDDKVRHSVGSKWYMSDKQKSLYSLDGVICNFHSTTWRVDDESVSGLMSLPEHVIAVSASETPSVIGRRASDDLLHGVDASVTFNTQLDVLQTLLYNTTHAALTSYERHTWRPLTSHHYWTTPLKLYTIQRQLIGICLCDSSH